MPELPLNAERRRVYRRRIAVCERLMREINSPNAEECLWDAIVAFAGYPFVTEKGLPLKYAVEGGEINLTITQDDPFVFLFIIYCNPTNPTVSTRKSTC